jgi:alanine racemase
VVIKEQINVARPTGVHIDKYSLLHNIREIRKYAPNQKIIAMVKANAYGCGLSAVIPIIEPHVEAFGVACLEEAMAIRKIGSLGDCVLFQGVFSADELSVAAINQFQCVIHQQQQLQWLLASPLPTPIKVWVKVNTGMCRLGFEPPLIYDILTALHTCPWVDNDIGLMTHFACADEPTHDANTKQLRIFNTLALPTIPLIKTSANSAAIMAIPESHMDVVRPGLMLYGVSPFPHVFGHQQGLMPVMRFVSAVSAIYDHPAGARIGYSGTWQTTRRSKIGIVPVGYGDGYPRHILPNTPVWINNYYVPIVGRISMDMLAIDLTDYPTISLGDGVELWGQYIPVEKIALAASTSPYELLCQLSPRVRKDNQ